jgi:hypothetical protein
MGSGPSAWTVVSDAIQRKVHEMRERHQKAKDDELDSERQIIMDGVRAQAEAHTLTDQGIELAQAKLRKLVPKDSIPIVDAYTKVMGHIRDARKKKPGQLGQPGQPPAQSSAQPSAQPPSGAPSAAAGADASQTPTQPPPAPPTPASPPANAPAAPPSMYPNAAQWGAAKGQEQGAMDAELAKSRLNTLKAMRSSLTEQGKELPKDLDAALTMWTVTGHMPSAASYQHKMHPVAIEDPAGTGELVQAMQDENEQGVVWFNGQQVEHPKFAPKWKPHTGVMQDATGKFFTVNLDPLTNQPVPGTENYKDLPPPAYLSKIRERQMMWFDDAGNQQIANLTTRTFINVPSNAGPGGSTPNVPPAFRELPKPKSGKGAGAGAGVATGATPKTNKYAMATGATKDTGVLSPAGEKVLMTTEPVVNQAKKLEKIFEDNPWLKDNDQAGYLLLPYIAYRLGYATDGALEQEIAGLSLGSVIEAASVLQGTSRAVSALQMAMVHTPNAKVDSPKQIYRKLHQDIIPRLEDVMTAANKYGRKRATAAVPPDMQAPPAKSQADQDAQKWLDAH